MTPPTSITPSAAPPVSIAPGTSRPTVPTATVPPNSVFRVRATTSMTELGKTEVVTATHELWLATDSRDARYEQHDASGQLVMLESRSGRVKVSWVGNASGGIPGVSASIAPDDELLMGVGQGMHVGELWNDPARAPPRQYSELNGTPAAHVAFPAYGQGEMPPTEFWFSEGNGLTLRESALQPDGHGEVSRRDWTYDLVEYLPTTALAADHFTGMPPVAESLKDISGTWYMTPDEAAAFKGFPIYWLGNNYDGLPLGATGISARYSVPTTTQLFDLPGTRDIHSVDVTYSYIYAPSTTRPPGMIQLLQEPVGQVLRREGAGYAPSVAAGAEQLGDAVVLFNDEARSARALLGKSLIELSGGSREELRALVATLIPLNE